MIEIHQLTINIGKKKILDRINFELNPGEVVAVIGANGAGKSTLLKAIAGQLPAAGGQIMFSRRTLNEWSARELAATRAVLSQSIQLSFSLSVLDVVMLGRFPFSQNEPEQESKAIAFWALEKVNLKEMAYRDLHTLSGGERQRAHFARVLCQLYDSRKNAHKYLLLDEPTASQDLSQQHRLLSLARQASRDYNYGVLMVLHDMNQAARFADRIIMLRKGKLIAAGQPRQVLTEQHIYRAFDMNCLVQDHPVYDCLHVTTLDNAFTPIAKSYVK